MRLAVFGTSWNTGNAKLVPALTGILNSCAHMLGLVAHILKADGPQACRSTC